MKMIQWNVMGLVLLALVLNSGLAQAFTLPGNSVPGIQKKIHPKINLPQKGIQKKIQGCPKLVAEELHIVRAVPQPARTGAPTYRFILNGTVKNKGFAGLSAAGLNIVRKQNGRVVKRVALKLFKQRVRRNQSFDLSHDLHVAVQSEAISRADASHSTFELNVLNLRNDLGSCADSSASVKTVTSNQVSRALPAQARGVNQRVGSINRSGKQKTQIGTVSPTLSKAMRPGLNKQVTRHGGKPLLPHQASSGKRHVLSGGHAGGFVPTQKPMFGPGSGKPITDRGGKLRIKARPEMKLVIDHIEDEHGQRLDSVIPGNNVKVFFKIQYTGNTLYNVYVKGRGGEGRTANMTLPAINPVLILPVQVRRDIPWTGDTWNPVFMLHINSMVAGPSGHLRPGPAVHSKNQRNEVVSSDFRIHWNGDLELVAIKRVTLDMQMRGGGLMSWFKYSGKPWNKWKGTGSRYPASISMIVTVRNNSIGSSVSGRKLTVKLTGLTSYNPVRNNRHYPTDLSYSGDGCSSAGCSVQVSVSIPPMSGYRQKDVRVVLQNLPATTWVDEQAGKRGSIKGYHNVKVSGYYMCSEKPRVPGSRIRIDATVDSTQDSRTSNNTMIQRFTFGGNGGPYCSGTSD